MIPQEKKERIEIDALVEAARFLNENIDEMWNECNTMAITEKHKAAIISAQRKLYTALASYTGGKEVKNG